MMPLPPTVPGVSPRPPGRAHRARSPRRAAGALVLALLLTTGACTDEAPDGGDPPAAGASSAPAATGPASAPVVVRTGEVVGRLPAARREGVVQRVGQVVADWYAAAFLDGPWPRSDVRDAFPGFTTGAREAARAERARTSAASLGEGVDAVRAARQRVVVDLLAHGGRVRGATARVLLDYVPLSGADEQVARRVQGRLSLTWDGDAWRVFAYDLTQGRLARAGEGAR